jgi:hypothetical protein
VLCCAVLYCTYLQYSSFFFANVSAAIVVGSGCSS